MEDETNSTKTALENVEVSNETYEDIEAKMVEAVENAESQEPEQETPAEESTQPEEEAAQEGPTEEEQAAMDKGWKPQRDFDDEEKDWVNAKEFLARKPLFDRITSQGKRMKNLERNIEFLTEMSKKQMEAHVKEKADLILQKKREAIESGDVELAENLEQKYYEAHKAIPSMEEKNDEPRQAARDFARRNARWFNVETPKNAAMREFAISQERQYSRSNPDWSDEVRLQHTERSVREMFPSAFENANRNVATRVTPAAPENRTAQVKPKKFTFREVPENHKPAIRSLANQLDMPLDAYAQIAFDNHAFD